VAATAAVSGIALYLWDHALHPDLSRHLAYIPPVPFWSYPFLGLGFAVLNAAMEEAAFRGIVMQATDSAFGPGVLSLLLQAGLFGALHFLQGFPKGAWGLGMAFAFGIMLGHIRRKSRGMVAPWLAHLCADLVIFAILASIMLGRTHLSGAPGR
jgi:membrane protease YdiL (CAAX protease family)